MYFPSANKSVSRRQYKLTGKMKFIPQLLKIAQMEIPQQIKSACPNAPY